MGEFSDGYFVDDGGGSGKGMRVRFDAAQWFLLIPALALLGWWRPALRLGMPLRAASLLALVLALAEPQWRALGKGLDLWLLLDRSASAAEEVEPRAAEIRALLERSKGPEDRVFSVDFADIAMMTGEGDEILPYQRTQTRWRLAVQYALARMDPDRAARVLMVTDGQGTESLDGLAAVMRAQEVALDYRLVTPPEGEDAAVRALRMPVRVQVGEPFLIEVEIAGSPDGTVPCVMMRDGEEAGAFEVELRGGLGVARFTERLARAGAAKYGVVALRRGDTRPGNDSAVAWVEVTGGPRVVLVTAFEGDPVAGALEAAGFSVEIFGPKNPPDAGRLAGARAVVFHDVPAHEVPGTFLEALPFFVLEQGGGLLMLGGPSSFGAGGYFESPLDPLLPVSMELRAEHRKLSVAMAVVMDRSGSMGQAVMAAGRQVQKMDLANEGAARCVESLGANDQVAIFAVDTQPHAVVPLTRVGNAARQIGGEARTIRSAGGGICVPTGLRAAWEALARVQTGQRHVVLFADANDATQELGDYPGLIKDMVADSVTISVIGLGKESDSGGKFLREVSELGKGRLFFNEDPQSLPAIFAQETVTVARSAFLKGPVGLEGANTWAALAGDPMEWPPLVDGYNLSYLRPEATGAAFGTDEYRAPLVAFWQRGAGRAAAVSFPMAGPHAASVRTWVKAADFMQTVGRWVGGTGVPPGLMLKAEREGTDLRLDLRYDAESEWTTRFASSPPSVAVQVAGERDRRAVPWRRMAPGHYRADVPLPPDREVRGAVRAGDHGLAFGPVIAGSQAEWVTDPARVEALRATAKATGGVERMDFAEVWSAPRRQAWRDVRAWCFAAFLLAFVAERLSMRAGWTRWA